MEREDGCSAGRGPSMRTALAVSAAPLAKLLDRARDYAADGRAGSTKKAYLSDFRGFEAWCASQGVSAMPARPELVALYAAALADVGRRVSTIERAVTAIAQVHRSRGFDWPRSHPALADPLGALFRAEAEVSGDDDIVLRSISGRAARQRVLASPR